MRVYYRVGVWRREVFTTSSMTNKTRRGSGKSRFGDARRREISVRVEFEEKQLD
jgi:hypothetical protein